ncbi:hypothetical protein, partial [Chromobacterium violaceum]
AGFLIDMSAICRQVLLAGLSLYLNLSRHRGTLRVFRATGRGSLKPSAVQDGRQSLQNDAESIS